MDETNTLKIDGMHLTLIKGVAGQPDKIKYGIPGTQRQSNHEAQYFYYNIEGGSINLVRVPSALKQHESTIKQWLHAMVK